VLRHNQVLSHFCFKDNGNKIIIILIEQIKASKIALMPQTTTIYASFLTKYLCVLYVDTRAKILYWID
jgi:hypothetical protein